MTSLEVLGPGLRHVHVADADAAAVLAALASLNGQGEVYLSATEPIWLGIAGGPDDFFVAWTDDRAGAIFQVRNAAASDVDGTFIIGGQTTTIAAAYLVPRADALSAAEHFIGSGKRAPGLRWDQM